MSCRALGIAALVACVAAGRAPAQQLSEGPVGLLRADAIVASRTTLQVGGGAEVALGYYVRVAVQGAAGIRLGDSPNGALAGRAEAIGRFLVDPFAQTRYGLSVGGGVGALFLPGETVRPVIIAVVDLEGPRSPSRDWQPALQLGLGGGVRIGVVLRAKRTGGR